MSFHLVGARDEAGSVFIRDEFKRCGWDNPPIIGKTRRENWTSGQFGDEPRGQQIADWLAENPVDSFIILDDDPNMLPEQMSRFVQTDMIGGFTDSHLKRALELFGSVQ